MRRFLYLVTKKCRIYAACGVSQTPIVSDTMKGKQEEANTPKGIMFKYIDKNQLNVENDDELIALINIFASISLGLFFKIFIMGKNM